MAQDTLVAGARRLASALEGSFGDLALAALLPVDADEDSSLFDARYAFVISAGWINEFFLKDVLTTAAVALQTLPFEDRFAISRIVVLPPSDSFVGDVFRLYAGSRHATPAAFVEPRIGGRVAAGGTLLLLRSQPPELEVQSVTVELDQPPLRQVVDLEFQQVQEIENDERVASAPLSSSRRASFESRFTETRERAATLRRIFIDSGAYERRAGPEDSAGYGIRRVFHKGPFVDDGSWAELDPWAIVVALETHLHTELTAHLSGAHAGPEVEERWDDIRNALLSASAFSERSALFCLQGQLSSSLLGDVARDAAVTDRYGVDNGPWFLGYLHGTPLVYLRNKGRASKAAYAIPLPRALQMVQFGSPEEPSSDYTIGVRDLTDEEIEGMITSQEFRDLNPSWHGLPDSLLRERLRARAVVTLYEYVRISDVNPALATRIKIKS
jgi:hypothetical protein